MKPHWLLVALLTCCDRDAAAGELEELLTRIRAGQVELRNWETEIPAVRSEREFTIRGETEKSTFSTYHHDRSILVLWEARRFCLTPNEAFGVEKSPTSNEYAVLFQTANKPEEFFQKQIGKNYLLVRPLTAAVQSSTVLDVLDREGFKTESITREGTDLVTLHYTRALPSQGDAAVDRGSLTFSVSNRYLLTRFEYVLPVKTGSKSRVLRGLMTRTFTTRDGRPIVTEVSQTLTSTPTDGGDNTTRVRYAYPAQGVSADEFRLTHYLSTTPPPLDVYEDRPPFNWQLWGSVGFGCLALSILLAWFVRRKWRT